jgi:magnesium transporter
VIVDCAVYRDGSRHPGALELDEAYAASRAPGAFVWIGLHEPTAAEFAAVQREFDLHELAVEDAVKAHQRPKIERYGESVLMVLKTARYVDPIEVIEFGEILIFAGEGFVVVVRHGTASALHDVRVALEQDEGALKLGPGSVLHAIADRVVDDYGPVLQGLDTDIEEVEEQVFSDQVSSHTVERIYKLKREVLEFHRATYPLLEPFEQLAQGRHPEAHGVQEYFRDVHDHLLRVNEQVDAHRELLTGILQANLALLGVRQNEDMRRISALVGVAAVPTVIGAIYGMNFVFMPELDERWGYPAALGLIAVGCLLAYLYFHRRGWL